jgi:hypothetical protein
MIAGTALAVGVIALAAALGVLRAFVISDLWFWFAVPLGAPAINTWQAYGLALIFSLLAFDVPKEGAGYGQVISASLFASLLSWGIGYIVAGLQ